LVEMTRYNLPFGMRYSTLEERAEFYKREFNVAKTFEWLQKKPGKTKLAVIIGRHSGIYPEKYCDDASTTIIIDEYTDLQDAKAQILDFLPEAVYYDRTVYDEKDRPTGQELAFDLDPENVVCPVHGSLADKMARNQGLSFCELELGIVKQDAVRLYDYLAQQFSEIKVVYSGRGFHIHVFDEETFGLSRKERVTFARRIKKEGFRIDEWVTAGEMRLIRLPYSLNGLVSRIVLPLEREEIEAFDPINDKRCLPQFLSR
jgi:DNA primase catalytic subunit